MHIYAEAEVAHSDHVTKLPEEYKHIGRQQSHQQKQLWPPELCQVSEITVHVLWMSRNQTER